MKDSSYHHFTLLLHTDQHNLSSALKPHPYLETRSSTATASIRSQVMNLSTLHPPITREGVVAAVADKFYQVHGVTEQHKVTNNYLSPNV